MDNCKFVLSVAPSADDQGLRRLVDALLRNHRDFISSRAQLLKTQTLRQPSFLPYTRSCRNRPKG